MEVILYEADVSILNQLDEIAIELWLKERIIANQFETSFVNIIFTSDEYLLSLNRQFLNHDYYTDVITFEKKTATGIQLEIYISLERAKENAIIENVTLLNEILRLIIHGVLHSEGMNDKEMGQAKEMRQKEDRAVREYFKCFT